MTVEHSCDDFLARAWTLCREAVDRRTDAFRTPTLASVHPAKGVQARVVVLRAASDARRALDVHSDARADKVAAIIADPRVALLFWDAERRLQVRIEGVATILDAVSSEGASVFGSLSEAARDAYRHRPDPGTTIASARSYQAARDGSDDPARRFFRLIRIEARHIEALSLANETQIRAVWTDTGEGWTGRWIVP